MAKDKTNGGSAGAAQSAAPAQAAVAPAETAKRTRLSFSKDKKLAYLITGLVAIFSTRAIEALLTPEQKTKIATAKAQADEVGGDPFKAVDDRITAIRNELLEAQKLMTTDLAKAAGQVKELSSELDRQIKRKAQIQEMIGG